MLTTFKLTLMSTLVLFNVTTSTESNFVAPEHYDYVMVGTYYDHEHIGDKCYVHAISTGDDLWIYMPEEEIDNGARVKCYVDSKGTASIYDDEILAMEVI